MTRFRSPPAGTVNADLHERIAELEERLRVQDQWRRELEQRVKELEAAAKAFVMAPGWDNEDELSALEAVLEGGEHDT